MIVISPTIITYLIIFLLPSQIFYFLHLSRRSLSSIQEELSLQYQLASSVRPAQVVRLTAGGGALLKVVALPSGVVFLQQAAASRLHGDSASRDLCYIQVRSSSSQINFSASPLAVRCSRTRLDFSVARALITSNHRRREIVREYNPFASPAVARTIIASVICFSPNRTLRTSPFKLSSDLVNLHSRSLLLPSTSCHIGSQAPITV